RISNGSSTASTSSRTRTSAAAWYSSAAPSPRETFCTLRRVVIRPILRGYIGLSVRAGAEPDRTPAEGATPAQLVGFVPGPTAELGPASNPARVVGRCGRAIHSAQAMEPRPGQPVVHRQTRPQQPPA